MTGHRGQWGIQRVGTGSSTLGKTMRVLAARNNVISYNEAADAAVITLDDSPPVGQQVVAWICGIELEKHAMPHLDKNGRIVEIEILDLSSFLRTTPGKLAQDPPGFKLSFSLERDVVFVGIGRRQWPKRAHVISSCGLEPTDDEFRILLDRSRRLIGFEISRASMRTRNAVRRAARIV